MTLRYAGTMLAMEKKHANADHPALRETTRPAYYQVAYSTLLTVPQDSVFLLIPVLRSVLYHPPGPNGNISKLICPFKQQITRLLRLTVADH